MQKRKLDKCILKLFAAIALLLFAGCNSRPNGDKDRTWSVYKADNNSSNYSPLDQINTSNVSQLKPAWIFSMADKKRGVEPGSSQCNPIIIDGVLYATSASQWAYAVNAETGAQLWSFDPFEGNEKAGEVTNPLNIIFNHLFKKLQLKQIL